jgi:2-polyprenyl-3-methyl-5-hydroxy-6-metoxy-1,4-benzoquinol methylase
MARKKASLGPSHRRPPVLRTASARTAGTGAELLTARRDTHRSVARAEPAAEPLMASVHGEGAENRRAIDAQLLHLVGPHKRVLVIGRDTWPLSRSLASEGCRVSVVETRHDAPAGCATFAEHVVVGDPDDLDLDATLDGAPFDAVVVVQSLEHLRHPVSMLTVLAKHLTDDGCVVAAVPNLLYGRIRLGFLKGRSPTGLLPSDLTAPSHWYDRAALEEIFERAGLVITRLERHTETFDENAPELEGTPVPAEIVDILMQDADATTRAFLVVAHRSPLTGPVLLEMRVRELAQAHDQTMQQMNELAKRAEGLDARCAELKRTSDAAVSKLDRIGSEMQLSAESDSRLRPSLAAARQRLVRERMDLEAISRDLKRFQYEQLISRVRVLVEATVPEGDVVLVVSKGDERLIDFRGRTGWHFLRNEQGVYAGHHPTDSRAAIEALERMRADGAAYLVLPQVALWWLDHYAVFREHLDRHCRVVVRDERTCVIYALAKAERAR